MDYVAFDALCKKRGTTATALALKLGLSKGNTSSWRKGGNPSAEILIKLADELNCTVDVLLGRKVAISALNDIETSLLKHFNKLNDVDKGKVIGKAETLAELADERAQAAKLEQNTPEKSNQTIQLTPRTYVPLCALPVSAGTGVYLDDNRSEPLEIKRSDISEMANYAVKISGDSMLPLYNDGDIVLVETCPSVDIGEIGIFILDGEGFIKEYGGDCLISHNEKYKDIQLKSFDNAVCLGRVLGKAELN